MFAIGLLCIGLAYGSIKTPELQRTYWRTSPEQHFAVRHPEPSQDIFDRLLDEQLRTRYVIIPEEDRLLHHTVEFPEVFMADDAMPEDPIDQSFLFNPWAPFSIPVSKKFRGGTLEVSGSFEGAPEHLILQKADKNLNENVVIKSTEADDLTPKEVSFEELFEVPSGKSSEVNTTEPPETTEAMEELSNTTTSGFENFSTENPATEEALEEVSTTGKPTTLGTVAEPNSTRPPETGEPTVANPTIFSSVPLPEVTTPSSDLKAGVAGGSTTQTTLFETIFINKTLYRPETTRFYQRLRFHTLNRSVQ